MKKPIFSAASRRAFLRHSRDLGIAGMATPWALNLATMAEAAAATASDYKALVCVFLYGGNDYGNTLIPVDTNHYPLYKAQRPALAISAEALAATTLSPIAPPLDRNGEPYSYALAPGLLPLMPLWQAGQMAVMLNVGTLIQPTTKAQYLAKSVKLPPKLFSHNDQQAYWQASAPEGAPSGWGGRIGDLLQSGNGLSTFTCVNVSGNAVFVSGGNAAQYQVSTSGSVAINGIKSALYGSTVASDALRTLLTNPRSNWFEAEYGRVSRRSIDANEVLSKALAGAPSFATNFPSGNSLADQLKLVARMIVSADAIQAKRQVFFVSLGGFDNHDGILTVHPGLMDKVGQALSAFYSVLSAQGVAQQVTSFTSSDFGRTLAGNNDGSDHGWGSMHFVVGGAVRGQRFYGTAPIVANNGADDVGQGRLLPSTSVDQYAATLAKWFGLSDSQLLDILPSLVNFNASQRTLGFV
jgi:uncharacterized protein (DUF1501 family)